MQNSVPSGLKPKPREPPFALQVSAPKIASIAAASGVFVPVVQEPFGNAVFATSAQDLAGRSVAVLGCGPIGLFTIGIGSALLVPLRVPLRAIAVELWLVLAAGLAVMLIAWQGTFQRWEGFFFILLLALYTAESYRRAVRWRMLPLIY